MGTLRARRGSATSTRGAQMPGGALVARESWPCGAPHLQRGNLNPARSHCSRGKESRASKTMRCRMWRAIARLVVYYNSQRYHEALHVSSRPIDRSGGIVRQLTDGNDCIFRPNPATDSD
jgi:hypothetical protein